MAARPTEVRHLAALLQEGAESPEDLAKLCINELDRIREDRVGHIVVTEWKGPVFLAYGPFATRNQAEKAVEKGKVPAVAFGRSAYATLYHPNRAEKEET